MPRILHLGRFGVLRSSSRLHSSMTQRGETGAVVAQGGGGAGAPELGYVLKPPWMRGTGGGAHARDKPANLSLRVLAGRALPASARPEANMLVRCSVHGPESENVACTTKPVGLGEAALTARWTRHGGVGESPVIMSLKTRTPSVAVFVCQLRELDEVKGRSSLRGVFAAPVNALRSGLRWVPLWEPSGQVRLTRHGSLAGLLVQLSISWGA